jgi:hypothetical protein
MTLSQSLSKLMGKSDLSGSLAFDLFVINLIKWKGLIDCRNFSHGFPFFELLFCVVILTDGESLMVK